MGCRGSFWKHSGSWVTVGEPESALTSIPLLDPSLEKSVIFLLLFNLAIWQGLCWPQPVPSSSGSSMSTTECTRTLGSWRSPSRPSADVFRKQVWCCWGGHLYTSAGRWLWMTRTGAGKPLRDCGHGWPMLRVAHALGDACHHGKLCRRWPQLLFYLTGPFDFPQPCGRCARWLWCPEDHSMSGETTALMTHASWRSRCPISTGLVLGLLTGELAVTQKVELLSSMESTV